MCFAPLLRSSAYPALVLLLVVVPVAALHAQQAPYDVFPPADPPYYRVRYEPSKQPGELVYGVNYTAWIPPDVKTVRGVIVHQHGCGEGSCKSGLTGAYDLHWQALAKKHGCALLAPAYEQPEKADCQMWCDPRNGSSAAFLRALNDLGAKSGHPELSAIPWALWGHSGGGHWAGGMVLLHPERVAAAWLRSGVPQLKPNPDRPTIKAHALPDAALGVPMMCNLGTKEGVTVKDDRFSGVWPANEAFFNEVRARGGHIGVAVDPLTSHECGNQRYLAIPWLDACLAARLPNGTGEPMRAMPAGDAWLALPTGSEALPASKFSGDPLKAGWLPDAAIARAWMRYVKDTNLPDATPPPAPTNLRVDGNTLRWECEADLESGLAVFIIERDGEVLARLSDNPRNPFGRPLFQNLQYSDTPTQPLVAMQFIDATAKPGMAHAYKVIAVNSAGTRSEPSGASRSGQLVQVRQDFSRDPGWEHHQNRIVGTDMPAIIQDFGWRRTNYTGGPGEIGGRVENSRLQAYYAMPLGKPLTFNDELSASGKLVLRHIGLRGVGYVGFFNSRRHTWRVWSSMAFRVWEEDDLGQVMFDWMSSDWKARGAETAILLPADSKVHAWSFRYEPEARADPTWHDEALKRHITDRTGNGQPYELQGEEHLFERLKKEEPGLTREELHRRLLKVRDQGLVEFFQRHNMHRWWKRPDAGQGHGRVTLQFDAETPYVIWFDEEIRRSPVEFDRFGLFNIARFGTRVEMYLGDLVVNGQRIDLSQDPHWEGRNNESRYAEPNFHAMHSYGWSQTNWAGERPGEIGGLFWRTEPPDPLCSYYGDDVGELTLDDPISFSGTICFVDGMTDAAAYFGYFNRDNQVRPFDPARSDAFSSMASSLGIAIADSSAVGYYFTPNVTSASRDGVQKACEVFRPDRRRRRVTFDYDPKGNGGKGRATVTLDGRAYVLDLTSEQRKSGAVFNRFGLANVRSGGHSVEFYLDDVSYTARREPGTPPKFIPQTTVKVPYPHKQAGRRY